jgi:citrate synthase
MTKTDNEPDLKRTPRPARRPPETTLSRTAITSVEPNRILLRGYPLDEAMGRISFAEAVYLLLTGELPTPAIGKLMDALLVSSIDHGSTPPSTLAARNVATSGAPLRASVAAGILGFGKYHGGDIELAMRTLERGVSFVRNGLSFDAAAHEIVETHRERQELVPGFGHRLHSFDPRSSRLFQMALELDLDGPCLHMSRAIERVLNADQPPTEPHITINVDGAIAAICCDIGFPPELGQAFFIVSRVPGLVAQAYEEQTRERPMHEVGARGYVYDGPAERRLPETRK